MIEVKRIKVLGKRLLFIVIILNIKNNTNGKVIGETNTNNIIRFARTVTINSPILMYPTNCNKMKKDDALTILKINKAKQKRTLFFKIISNIFFISITD